MKPDENLHDLIMTEVENGILKIHTKKNIGNASSKKVMVSFKEISSIKSTSGSDVFSTNTINANQLELTSTSGSDMELDIIVETLNCKSTSGSQLTLRGKNQYTYCFSYKWKRYKSWRFTSQLLTC